MQANRDTWHWVSGKTVSYIFWGEGQPNNYNREQNCAVLDSQLDWRWNDLSCKVSLTLRQQFSWLRKDWLYSPRVLYLSRTLNSYIS